MDASAVMQTQQHHGDGFSCWTYICQNSPQSQHPAGTSPGNHSSSVSWAGQLKYTEGERGGCKMVKDIIWKF